jgi:hypothetical protein
VNLEDSNECRCFLAILEDLPSSRTSMIRIMRDHGMKYNWQYDRMISILTMGYIIRTAPPSFGTNGYLKERVYQQSILTEWAKTNRLPVIVKYADLFDLGPFIAQQSEFQMECMKIATKVIGETDPMLAILFHSEQTKILISN